MRIYGIEITEQQQNACLGAMNGKFKSADIEKAAIVAGCPKFCNVGRVRPEYFANRVADRLLQRERAAGRIKFNGIHWVSNV